MRPARIILCLLAILVLCATAQTNSSMPQIQKKRIVIGASMLLDGRGHVLHNTRIVVEGSKIAALDHIAALEPVGRGVEDVRLRFEGGRVVKAEAAAGQDYLLSLLDMDEGSRILGEAAFGLNYEIDRFTRDILFDEKIGGTMHLALGASFKKVGGLNESGLHWDMICDLREEGEVYADGELVWKAGRFLSDVNAEAAASVATS